VVWAGADRRTEEQAVSHQVVPGEFYFWRISCVLLLLLLAGCLSDAPHATTLSLVRGDLLPLDHPWTRTRLEVEAGHDPTLRRWLAAEGLPDYLLVDSEERLRMFYVATDQMVVFQREDEPASAAEVLPRIGALYHARFSDAHRSALAQLRFDRAGLAMNPEWQDPRPASERDADAVADLRGQEPWRPGSRAPARRQPPALDPVEPEEQDVAFSAQSRVDVAFRAWSRAEVAFAAWSTAGRVRFVSISGSMGGWSTARADSPVHSSRSLR